MNRLKRPVYPTISILLGTLLAAASPARADIFEFTGDCGNSGWFACCDGPQCATDPVTGLPIFLKRNNWGRVGPCGNCPDLETQYPGPGDVVIVGDFVAALSGVSANVESVDSNPGAGGLDLANTSFNTNGNLSVFQLDLFQGTIACGGVFHVRGGFTWTPLTSPLRAPGGYELTRLTLNGLNAHAFDDGPVTVNGKADWNNGQIDVELGLTLNGELNCNGPGTTGRHFTGGPVDNRGVVRTNNDNPGGGQAIFNFNTAVDTSGDGRIIVGAETTLNLNQGGSYVSALAIQIDQDGVLKLGGSLTPYVIGSSAGVDVQDISPDGSATVHFFNVRVPDAFRLTVGPMITDTDNLLEVFGDLGADEMNMTGRAINGGGTGSLDANDLLDSGVTTKEMDDLRVLIRDGWAANSPGLEIDKSTVTIGAGTPPGAVARFDPMVGTTYTTTFRVDLVTDRSTLEVAPNSQAVYTAPASTTFTRLGPGSADFLVDGLAQFRSPITTVNANVNVDVGPTGRIQVGPCPTGNSCGNVFRVFSEFDLDGTLTVEPGNVMDFRGPDFTGTNAVLEFLGTFTTGVNQNNPVNLATPTITVGPDASVTFHTDNVQMSSPRINLGPGSIFRFLASQGDIDDPEVFATFDGTSRIRAETGSTVNVQNGRFTGGSLESDATSRYALTGPANEFRGSKIAAEIRAAFNLNNIAVSNGPSGEPTTFNNAQVTLSNGASAVNNGQAVFTGTNTLSATGGSTFTNAATGDMTIDGGVTTFRGQWVSIGDWFDFNGATHNIGSPDGLNPANVTHDGNWTITGGATGVVQPNSSVSGSADVTVAGGATLETRGQVAFDELNVSSDSSFKGFDSLGDLIISMQGTFGRSLDGNNPEGAFGVAFAFLFGAIEINSGFSYQPSETVVSVTESLAFDMVDELTWSWDPGTVLALVGGVGAPVGRWADWTRLEIGGTDLGNVPAGFDGNFDLSILRIGPGAHAYVQDAIDNGNRNGPAGAAEAVYVDVLEFADAAGLLNVNGRNIYFGQLIGSPSQIIDTLVLMPGDIDGDGDVDMDDHLLFVGVLVGTNTNPEHVARSDLNFSGAPDGEDIPLFVAAIL